MDDYLADGTRVTYHGSITHAHGLLLYAEECGCDRLVCGYQLVTLDDDVVLQHVRRRSITPA